MRALFLAVLIVMAGAGMARAEENAYERVNRTSVIRCGYVEWPGYLEKDAATGKMSGAAYDVAEAIAKELEMKIEWTESVGWGTYAEGLNTGRYDVACGGFWESGNRIRISLLTRPLFYSGMYVVVRDDDTRFDKGFDALNKPDVKFQTMDADVTDSMYQQKFPKAKRVALSGSVDIAQYFMSITQGKADAGFASVEQVTNFNKNNPDKKIKLAAGGKPIRAYGNSFAVKKGETELKMMLDSTIDALINSGELPEIARKRGEGFIPATPGYQP